MDAYGKRNIFLFILPELDLSWNLIILYLQGELKKHTMANIDMYIDNDKDKDDKLEITVSDKKLYMNKEDYDKSKKFGIDREQNLKPCVI